MAGKDTLRIAIFVIVVAIAVVAVAAVLSLPKGTVPEEEADTGPTVPEGFTYDRKACTLSFTESIAWTVKDGLKQYIDRDLEENVDEYEGDSITLDPGLWMIEANGVTFYLPVDGKGSKTLNWKYMYNGEIYDIGVTYEIDLYELGTISIENRAWNAERDGPQGQLYLFKDLPRGVYVNDTVRSIVSQLESRFKEIGGSLDDRQGFADFLVSMAQLGIEYPNRSYTWTDENGDPVLEKRFGEWVPKTSTDYQVWGCEEYWANTLETLYIGIGDCDDSSAVACALFKAAGYRTAMVGVPGHVTSSVVLESFEERDMDAFKEYNKLASSFVAASGHSALGDDTETLYYGVDTIHGQMPVGYLLSGNAASIGKPTLNSRSLDGWGIAGFYPVPDE